MSEKHQGFLSWALIEAAILNHGLLDHEFNTLKYGPTDLGPISLFSE